uniref:Carboxylic ester hydrolase n=5 Tax=Anoplophora glabripennis TaxID=217634 RepID=A0A8F8N264_ANOGL|nr:carboxylesterase [Anoplophora glabripennis]QYA72003.1 carboxylesterase [Anoplophora glabripennis]
MVESKTLIVLLLCEISLSIAHANDPTLVSLPQGQIRGRTLHSPNGKVYYAFQEIPYATPPVEGLRFQTPREPPKWSGVLNTTKNTKICCKTDTVVIPGTRETEDCLYLNVFTPLRPGDSSKPPLAVLIWIHGGGFSFGTGVVQLYKPQYFMDYDIIVVTINYRLGALGFLATEDGVIPGNLGLKDQRFAIKWVKKNINLFGGDPDKITIAGASAGSTSVGFHMISPKNRGLFRGAILQSGSPINKWTRQDYARLYAFELGRSLDPNFKSNDSKELLKLLQKTPASKIINNTVAPIIGKETGSVEGTGYLWLPIIEDANLEGALLTGSFYEAISKGKINKVPTMLTFNSEEELLFWKPAVTDVSLLLEARAKYYDNDLSNIIRNKFNMTKQNKVIAGRKIRQIYTNRTFQENFPGLVKFFSDESFTTAITRHAKLQSNYTDVYLGQFSYQGKMGGMKDFEVAGVRGVGHGEELGYLFDMPVSRYETPDDPEDLVTRQRLLTLWSNFVKYLNPTPEEDNVLNNVIWKKLTPNNLVYLNINKTLEMEKNPKEYLKWEKIIDAYAIPPFNNY